MLTFAEIEKLTRTPSATIRRWVTAGVRVGCDGDLVLVDESVTGPLPLEWLRSRAGFSPYAGMALSGWPRTTIRAGVVIYSDHEPVGEPMGRPLTFEST